MTIKSTVGDFCPFLYGKGLSENDRATSGVVPVFGSNGIVGKHNIALTKGPTVIIGRKGTVGAVHFSPEPCWPIDTTFYVECQNLQQARFLYYLLKTLGLDKMNSDSAVPGLNRNAAHSRSILLPEENIRNAIAHILGSLDDKIELNHRMNQTLEAIARAIFKSWFIDFDPVRAKAEGRDTGHSAEIANLFPNAFISSDIGELPEGWEVDNVFSSFNLIMGQSPPGNTYNQLGDGIPFFQGRSDFGFRFPTNRVYCTSPTRYANAGDTLVSVRAPVGDINIALERCSIGRGVAAIRHKSNSVSYTYYLMKSIEENLKIFEAEGTVFGSINKVDFQNLQVIKPSIAIINCFENYCHSFDKRIEINEKQSRNLSTLRDTLLPKLLSGQIRIPDAERFLMEHGL